MQTNKTERYEDGYVEWKTFDEDGAFEPFAELSGASSTTETLELAFPWEDRTYKVLLQLKDGHWIGKYERRESGLPRTDFGKCYAEAKKAPPNERRFEGKWFEDGEVFTWRILLRVSSDQRQPRPPRTSGLEPPMAPRARNTRGNGSAPFKLEPGAREKLERMRRAFDDLLSGAMSSPQLVEEAIRVHDIVFRGLKKRRKKWP